MAKFKINQSQKINHWLQSAINDKFMKLFFFCWIIPILLTIIFCVLNFSDLPKQIPLFYSRNWGEDQLALKGYIFVPVVGSFMLGIINFSLGINFHSRDKIVAYFLAGASAVISLMASITTFNIIKLIT